MNKLLLSAIVILSMTACEQKAEDVSSNPTGTDSIAANIESNEDRNKQNILASMNALMAGNVDSALSFAASEITEYGDGTSPVVKSIDTLKQGMKAMLAAFPDYKGENLVAVADGDQVIVYGDWSGTFKNDYMGMKATGKSFKIKDADIFTFTDDGKIKEHRSIYPWMVAMQQLGAKPPKK